MLGGIYDNIVYFETGLVVAKMRNSLAGLGACKKKPKHQLRGL